MEFAILAILNIIFILLQDAGKPSSTLEIFQWLTPWIGPAIVAAVVTFVGQYFLFKRQNDKEKTKRNIEAYSLIVSPLIESVDEIIARVFDLIVRKKNLGLETFQLPKKLSETDVLSPSPVLTMVFRVAKYFACASYLQRRLSEYSDVESVKMADFFVGDKVRMAFKGNLAGASSKIPTETQQFIGAKFLSLSINRQPDDLDYYTFMTKSISDEESEWAVKAIAKFYSVDPDFTKKEPQQIALALVTIYMIDLFQDLKGESKWEEFRVFLTSLIRSTNMSTAARAKFLYSQDDLKTKDYFATFPKNGYPVESYKKKEQRIMKRQSRDRKISSTGVVSPRSSMTLQFDYDQAPGDLLHKLESLL